MTNGDRPKPGAPLADVVAEISRRVVADRLEAILPGLHDYAMAQDTDAGRRRDEILARRYPGMASSVLSPEALVLKPDYILDHARSRARIESDQIGEDQISVRSDSVVRRVLRDLPTLDGDILTVSFRQRCFRIPAAYLVDFVLHGDRVTGDLLLDGDDLFVCARSPRVIVLHHEGWVFDVNA
jgi:hypothetical protein